MERTDPRVEAAKERLTDRDRPNYRNTRCACAPRVNKLVVARLVRVHTASYQCVLDTVAVHSESNCEHSSLKPEHAVTMS